MDFIDIKLSQYAENHTSAESELLYNLNRDTYANVLIPRMLSGHLQGRTLSMISKLIQPKTIVEIGTYTGYSALCLAEGLKEGGTLHTIEINEELESRIRKFINQSEYKDSIVLHIGNAMNIIPTIKEQIDLVFIDADKENYVNYVKKGLQLLSDKGIFVIDNCLWSGRVIDENDTESSTQGIRNLNDFIKNREDLYGVLLPIRDGMFMVSRK